MEKSEIKNVCTRELVVIANRNATTALYLRKRQNIEILHQVNRKKVDTFGIFDLPLTIKKKHSCNSLKALFPLVFRAL